MTGLPADLPVNLGNLLARAGVGGRTVLIDLRTKSSPVEFSADQLDVQVQAVARGLLKRGIQPGQKVGILSANRWEMLVVYLGTLYMGGISVPINHKFSTDTLRHIFDDADVSLMFCDEQRKKLVSRELPCINFDDGNEFEKFMDPGSLDAFDPDDRHCIAEILYTSGSTGLPKGVPLSHHGQLWALSKYLEPVVRNEATGRNLIVAPLYHMNALFYSTLCLLNATTIIYQPNFVASDYIVAVAQYQCTHLSGVPTMFAMIAALDKSSIPQDLSCVTYIGIGSAPLSEALLAQVSTLFPSATIANGYGTTEAGPAVFGNHPEGKPMPPMSIGYPLPDIEWRFNNESDQPEGVIELKTSALTEGYLHRPEADLERFNDGWFNTNDIMRRDSDGFFYFVSRADDMFVCGGENIYPSEVELLLNRHPDVQQSFVVGAPDDIKGMVPVAFVVPMHGASIAEDELKQFALDNGPAYLHPRAVVLKSELPLGGTNKIDRRVLEREAKNLMQASGRAA